MLGDFYGTSLGSLGRCSISRVLLSQDLLDDLDFTSQGDESHPLATILGFSPSFDGCRIKTDAATSGTATIELETQARRIPLFADH